ncbi:MAG TPA: HAMP domain-containing sensor histidine kinase [Rhizomicrobium sp.]|nr:HAMP domain-containing sensor histidine kinase [Rhizomicrobium sp.]
MTAETITETPVKAEYSRMLQARLDMVVAQLPIAAWLNPGWALVSVVPYLGMFPALGNIAPWRLAAAIGLHLINSFLANVLYRQYRRDPLDTRMWFRKLTAFQSMIGMSWGAMVWLLWEPGNAINHIAILAPIVAVLWAYASSRVMHIAIYAAGVGPTAVLAMARFLTDPSGIAWPTVTMFLLTLIYTFIQALGAARQVEIMLRTRFANDDLTNALRETRDEALKKRFEAEAANASKTTFLANMSHELRTPLNAILGFSDIIANETFGPVGTPRYREYAGDINASGTHLLAIINDILDIAKIESGKMEVEPQLLNPRLTIQSALRVLLVRAREKRQNMQVAIADDVADVFADERAFKQIVINLGTNAVKFTQEGGEIVISGRRMADGGFELCISDNGPGISPALLDRIFTPFNQIDNRYNRQEGGTGLGLSLVRGLAELHGGRAWIETEIGQGVRAHVVFPPAKAAPPQFQGLRATA